MFRLMVLIFLTITLVLVGCTHQPPAEPLSVGQKVDFTSLQDQFDHSFKKPNSMHQVVFVNNMKTKELMQEALAKVNTACLSSGKVIYLANISEMPSLISKWIAVPRMQKYSYPVWLDRKGEISSRLPAQVDQVSILTVNSSAIDKVEFVNTSDVLAQRLQAVCGMPVAQGG